MQNVPAASNPSPAKTTPAPPAIPGPNATREEWREWRRRQRAYIRAYVRPYGGWFFGIWGWFWAVALIVVGGYYLLANLGLLDWTRGDILWPSLLIVLGVLVLINRFRPWNA